MLYLTYDSSYLQDGAGAQLLRIICTYIIASYYEIGYIHTPLKKIGYHGLSSLEEKDSADAQIDRYNRLFHTLSSFDIPLSSFDQIIQRDRITVAELQEYKKKATHSSILLQVGLPVFLFHEQPQLLLHRTCLPAFEWISSPMKKEEDPVRIGVHIRRGDIQVVERDIRYLPNSYYLNIIKTIDQTLKHIPHEFHIYTESATQPIALPSMYGGSAQSILYPESFDEFSSIRSIVWHINTDPVDSFIELCNYDILVISISAYSYLAGVLSPHTQVIYPPRSHMPSHPSWIDMTQPDALTKDPYRLLPYLTYCSGGLLGDFIHQLSIVYEMYLKTGKKGKLYISQSARRLEVFPFGIKKAYEDTYPIIHSQPYIHSYHLHYGEPYDINLSSWAYNQPLYQTHWKNMFRKEYGIEWCSHPYLTLPKQEKYQNAIFISCSTKRFNSSLSYSELIDSLPSKPIFVTSIKEEYDYFVSRTGRADLEWILFEDLYHYYCAIASCKLFIGHLSSPLTIAQACFVPRIAILYPNYSEGDNIHMNGIDWCDSCLNVYRTDDLQKINAFLTQCL